MSNISNVHNITAYTSGVTKPFSGQRLATVTYKVDKKTNIKPASVCSSIPALDKVSVMQHADKLVDIITALFERTQDKIIREIHESGKKEVQDSDISLQACVDYMQQENTGGRLNKAIVQEWFDVVLADPLAAALAAKLGVSEIPTQEQSNKIEVLLVQFRDKFGALTAGATKYDPDTCNQLQKALSLIDSDDELKDKFMDKLDVMKNKVPASIADAL